MSENKSINIIAVGDVCVNRQDPDSMFTNVTQTIKAADIAFCQLETNFTNITTPVPQAGIGVRASPKNAQSIGNAGFDTVSYASNHCMDFGKDGFFDTIKYMKETGIDIFGVGKNINEARKSKIVECKGHKIAFLTYNSILPCGYWATEKKPGCVPLRAWTIYEQLEPEQPGTPAKINTLLYKDDKDAMIKDIIKAKADADLVVVSMHWGIHFKEAEIAEYQREAAYVAIDSGADIILGHHSHILKPIEKYNNKIIFYSLGNFAFDLPLPDSILESQHWKDMMKLNPSWEIDKRYKSYPFPADSRLTMACHINVSEGKIVKVSIIPGLINENSQPRFLTSKERGFKDFLNYIDKICKLEELSSPYKLKGEEVILL